LAVEFTKGGKNSFAGRFEGSAGFIDGKLDFHKSEGMLGVQLRGRLRRPELFLEPRSVPVWPEKLQSFTVWAKIIKYKV
jgi:hypothetical protein